MSDIDKVVMGVEDLSISAVFRFCSTYMKKWGEYTPQGGVGDRCI